MSQLRLLVLRCRSSQLFFIHIDTELLGFSCCSSHWVVELEGIRRLCDLRRNQHYRRIACTLVWRHQRHTTVDRFNKLWETVELELPTANSSNLAAPTHMSLFVYSLVTTSAGSLAVILQPAFLPFVQWLICLDSYFKFLSDLNSFRLTAEPMFITV